jgi:hypothetical protein
MAFTDGNPVWRLVYIAGTAMMLRHRRHRRHRFDSRHEGCRDRRTGRPQRPAERACDGR